MLFLTVFVLAFSVLQVREKIPKMSLQHFSEHTGFIHSKKNGEIVKDKFLKSFEKTFSCGGFIFAVKVIRWNRLRDNPERHHHPNRRRCPVLRRP